MSLPTLAAPYNELADFRSAPATRFHLLALILHCPPLPIVHTIPFPYALVTSLVIVLSLNPTWKAGQPRLSPLLTDVFSQPPTAVRNSYDAPLMSSRGRCSDKRTELTETPAFLSITPRIVPLRTCSCERLAIDCHSGILGSPLLMKYPTMRP